MKHSVLHSLHVFLLFSSALFADEASVKIDVKQEAKMPFLFSAHALQTSRVEEKQVEHTIELNVTQVQGESGCVSLELIGAGEVKAVFDRSVVQGDGAENEQPLFPIATGWAVRQAGGRYYLDLEVGAQDGKEFRFLVSATSPVVAVPSAMEFLHLGKGDAVGFASEVTIEPGNLYQLEVRELRGFAPVAAIWESEGLPLLEKGLRFQTATGGLLKLEILSASGPYADAQWESCSLSGILEESYQSVLFEFTGSLRTRKRDQIVPLLAGYAAMTKLPDAPGLSMAEQDGQYALRVEEPGVYPIEFDFRAGLQKEGEWTSVDFQIPSATILPVIMNAMSGVEFAQENALLMLNSGKNWTGYTPMDGQVAMKWRSAQREEQGSLFYSSESLIDLRVESGLVRQESGIRVRVLQGEMASIEIVLEGEGEITEVAGEEVLSWERIENTLRITFREAVESELVLSIRSQVAMSELPVTVRPLSFSPMAAVRHAGALRVSSAGAVRLEVKEASGLMQLAPEEFPAEAIAARQVLAYRFPIAEYDLAIEASRVAAEVSINEVVVHKRAESDRVLRASIELDIREAALREWEMEIPADYSVVSVSGAAVSDYVVGSEEKEGRRILRFLFGQEVMGRQLVEVLLEKSEALAEGDWVLPRLLHPRAKAVRGEVGVAATPGIRLKLGEIAGLIERPISTFPQSAEGLQVALSVRERDWSAVVGIERLPRSVEADVFHLYSLKDGTAYGSVVVNYFVTGSPVREWRLSVPEEAGNIGIEGQNVRTWRREGHEVIVTLQQAVSGLYTLLLTCEEAVGEQGGEVKPGRVQPLDVRGERGYIQVVSPVQVKRGEVKASDDLLKLDALELPAEFRLSSPAPSLAVYQYTTRPFEFRMALDWYEPGDTVAQVVEFAEAVSRISRDGETLTEVIYQVKSRGGRVLRMTLPEGARLWELQVAGEAVNARKDGKETLIPLPSEAGAKEVLEVRLRYGKEAKNAKLPKLALPAVAAPILKTTWEMVGDERRALQRVKGDAGLAAGSGFARLANHKNSLLGLLVALVVFAVSFLIEKRSRILAISCLVLVLGILLLSASQAWQRPVSGTSVLEYDVPVLSPNEPVEMVVRNLDKGEMNVTVWPLLIVLAGLAWLMSAFAKKESLRHLFGGVLLCASGLLSLTGGAVYFLLAAALSVAVVIILKLKRWWPQTTQPAAVILIGLFAMSGRSEGAMMTHLTEDWSVEGNQVFVNASLTMEGRVGESVLLLKEGANLTAFTGEGLLLEKKEKDGVTQQMITISTDGREQGLLQREARFSYVYQLPADAVMPVLTAAALRHLVTVKLSNRPGWEVGSDSAASLQKLDDGKTALMLLPKEGGTIWMRARQRDPLLEKLQFFVESSQGYVPGPGLLEGRHQVSVRPVRGVVRTLEVEVPEGLAVTAVDGESIKDWQFTPDTLTLRVNFSEPFSEPVAFLVATQRSLKALPLELELRPLRITGAERELGMIGLGFRGQVQAERVAAANASEVNLADFDVNAFPQKDVTLHRAYRYGAEDAVVTARIVPVEPELRVSTNELLSLGEERTLLKVDAKVSVTRVGLFQLKFRLPEGYEMESLTSEEMSHWTGGESGEVTIHLREQTTGDKLISLVLVKAGAAEAGEGGWSVPRVSLLNAARQSGELLVRPEEGLRLRTIARRNVSEIDPRELARQAREGTALAFRLLQQDWELSLGIERLAPWVTGQVLHEITLREGQTRHGVEVDLLIEHASVRTLRVHLPSLSKEEARTLRATGAGVADLSPVVGEEGVWELAFKRRVIGKQRIRMEWERTGERTGSKEEVMPLDFPEIRQTSYYVVLRAGAQLEIETTKLGEGWYPIDWTAVPAELRGAAGVPVRALRAGAGALVLSVKRHALAESLKLRVSKGELTTVISPLGDQLTAGQFDLQVIQRDTLRISLEEGAHLYHIFVNGESAAIVRDGADYLFHVVPGVDGKTARVEMACSVDHEASGQLLLQSPGLSVPMENITWRIVVPEGFDLSDAEGDLELQEEEEHVTYGKDSYLAKISSLQATESQRARETSDQADALLLQGKQREAVQLYQNLANNANLDEAANEDARIKLERVQTEQVMAGLSTRRQRLYLDNRVDEAGGYRNDLLEQAAGENAMLQGDLNFRPDELGRLLIGNTREENEVLRRIAARLVEHQKATEPAPQALSIPVPEEGRVFIFRRTVSVEKDEPLQLRMRLQSLQRASIPDLILAICIVVAISGLLVWGWRH